MRTYGREQILFVHAVVCNGAVVCNDSSHSPLFKRRQISRGVKNKVGGENQIICITQAQKVPDRFRYTSYTGAAEDLSDARNKIRVLNEPAGASSIKRCARLGRI